MALCTPSQKLSLVSYAETRRARTKHSVTVRMAASSDLPTYEEGQLERPKWAGETTLSRLVGALISFKPISSVLKFGARQVLISTAEKNNIPWRDMTREILESDVYKELESIQNPSVVYPNYYLNPFHAYDEGNLSWLAAAEAEAANLSMTKRAIPYASSVDEANLVMRGNWLQAIEQHHQQCGGEIRHILDIGCSVGVSTKHLADKFPSAKVTGLDLSPYFLAVAQLKEKRRAPRKNPISWMHAKGEDTGLPSKSFDIVSICFVFHECPERAIIDILKEAFWLLRPGGTIAMEDIAPKSKKLQELPPVLFTLMKSTEPFLDEYCLTDLEGRMTEVGFVNIHSVLTSPRHRTITATVPN
ncbi:CMV 1a interacting protein 1 [Melia azedarach]|uniref:CMV 1a interacting protein 1 n=1 Tax=Melia azedarach TaxID=155640 RepID=A0ACC1Z427_MELAZ|nr:CMV 1a interacting protein 1 [Melia azedarach]